jgi:hypothetical protein
MDDPNAIESFRILGPKKVLVRTKCGALHQRRLKGDRFIYNDQVYEVRFGEVIKVA